MSSAAISVSIKTPSTKWTMTLYPDADNAGILWLRTDDNASASQMPLSKEETTELLKLMTIDLEKTVKKIFKKYL